MESLTFGCVTDGRRCFSAVCNLRIRAVAAGKHPLSSRASLLPSRRSLSTSAGVEMCVHLSLTRSLAVPIISAGSSVTGGRITKVNIISVFRHDHPPIAAARGSNPMFSGEYAIIIKWGLQQRKPTSILMGP